jgi:hypothetical protein
VKKEEKQITRKERELLQMEMLEMELIKNLQSTQSLQKTAYSDLEQALMLKTVTGTNSIMDQLKLQEYLSPLKKKQKQT